MKQKKFTKTALILSVILLIIWGILGTSASIAWFTDTTPVVKNSFVIGQLDLDVSFKRDVRDPYTPLEGGSSVFNNNALYEPNYTQVVYLKVENNGDIPFNYRLSVDLCGYFDSTNVYGQNLHLPQYLKYGVIFGEDEAELTRQLAQIYADRDMLVQNSFNKFSEPDPVTMQPGEARYVAMIVYMPWDVGNEANHSPLYDPPQVFLGVTVFAQQADAPLN